MTNEIIYNMAKERGYNITIETLTKWERFKGFLSDCIGLFLLALFFSSPLMIMNFLIYIGGLK